ncbi:MAG: hypothetical protein WBQ19_10720 [Terriglobales bacterium]|jgi:hypothetical protein
MKRCIALLFVLASAALAQPKTFNQPGILAANGTCTLAQEGLPQASCTVALPAGHWDAKYTVVLTPTNDPEDFYGGEFYVAYQDANGFVIQDTCTLEDGRTLEWMAVDIQQPKPFAGMEKGAN